MASSLKVGDTKEEPCSWCKRIIIKVYSSYPPATMIKGYHWDESACNCIYGLVNGGTIQWRMGRPKNWTADREEPT